MMQNDMITLTLPRNVIGQILDGIHCREDAYRNTADYLETGRVPDFHFIIEDVSDAEEARNLAQIYREII